VIVLLAGSSALANDASLQPGLTGDWNGTRTDLSNQGWQFQGKAVFEGAYNASGGSRNATTGAGEFDFVALADLGKLIGDQGGSLEATITDRFGAKLETAAGLPLLMHAEEIWGRGDIWRLTQLSFSQDMFGKTLNVEFGRLNPGSDFDTLACHFENLNFCGSVPGNIAPDYWYNAPVSQWGGRVKWNVSKTVYLEAGAYQTNPTNLRRGFSLDFSGGNGALIPFEADWKPALNGLPGEYKIGGWYATQQGSDVFYDIHRDPLAVTGLPAQQDRGRSGFYLSLKQQLTGEAPPKDAPPDTNGKGLTGFVYFTDADARTSTLNRQFSIGASYKGALDSRPDDEIALAFGTTHVNDRAARGEDLHDLAGLPFEAVQHDEYVTELDYRAQIVQGAVLTPNLQYISDPDGISARDSAFVLGLKANLTL
jgi:porin